MYTAGKNVSHKPPHHTTEPKSVEESQGTKRKTNPHETGDNKSTSMPLKKAKTSKEAPRSTSASVATRQKPASTTPRQKPASATPRQKPASATPRQKPAAPSVAAPSNTNKNSKKRSNLTDDAIPEDPKTPIPPLKKPRVNKNDAAREGNSKNPQEIRRTGNVSLDLKCRYVENPSTRNINI
jgi:hypothetical protein